MLGEHTYYSIISFDVSGPIKEADDALKFNVRLKPIPDGDHQPAGDFVIISILLGGGGVGRHTINYFQVVALPGHADMVWVETRGHTDQGLLLLPFFVFAFFF